MSTVRKGFLNGIGFVLGYYVTAYALGWAQRRLVNPEPTKFAEL